MEGKWTPLLFWLACPRLVEVACGKVSSPQAMNSSDDIYDSDSYEMDDGSSINELFESVKLGTPALSTCVEFCPEETECVLGNHSFHCRCRHGFRATVTLPIGHGFVDFCKDINECASSPCSARSPPFHGSDAKDSWCENLLGSYRCVCNALGTHFDGKTCAETVSCDYNPCLNKGQCVQRRGAVSCRCSWLLFSGQYCENRLPLVSVTIGLTALVSCLLCGFAWKRYLAYRRKAKLNRKSSVFQYIGPKGIYSATETDVAQIGNKVWRWPSKRRRPDESSETLVAFSTSQSERLTAMTTFSPAPTSDVVSAYDTLPSVYTLDERNGDAGRKLSSTTRNSGDYLWREEF